METIGTLLLAVGAWVIYCGAYGMDPAALAEQIIRAPGDASRIISQARVAAANDVNRSVQAGSTLTVGDGQAVVAFARRQLGKPYSSPGDSQNTWDCSGLTQAAYATVGVKLTHSAAAQLAGGVPISSRQDLQLGDLLFPTGLGVALGDHVQIFSGNGNCIEAADSAVHHLVIEHPMWGFSGDSVTARRYIKKPAAAGAASGIVGSGGSGVPR